ncbi:hypothetical protein U1Q18_049535 [Sarracenia purpurea var. burkii]
MWGRISIAKLRAIVIRRASKATGSFIARNREPLPTHVRTKLGLCLFRENRLLKLAEPTDLDPAVTDRRETEEISGGGVRYDRRV